MINPGQSHETTPAFQTVSQSFVIPAKAGMTKDYIFFKFIDITPKVSNFYVMTQSVRGNDSHSNEILKFQAITLYDQSLTIGSTNIVT